MSAEAMREKVAEMLDDAHGPCVTEGGCDFRASWRSGRYGDLLRYDEVVDQVIHRVRVDQLWEMASEFEEAAAAGIEPVLNLAAAALMRGRALKLDAERWSEAPSPREITS